jgi:hypothetical protein
LTQQFSIHLHAFETTAEFAEVFLFKYAFAIFAPPRFFNKEGHNRAPQ